MSGGYIGGGKRPIALLQPGTFADKAATVPQDFAVMPSVGGDPVVESGSNVDGEWTRWADGTQHCYGRLISVYGGLGDGWYDVLWTYPISFIVTPPCQLITPSGMSSLNNNCTANQIGQNTSNGTLSNAQTLFTVEKAGAGGSVTPGNLGCLAIGRWK